MSVTSLTYASSSTRPFGKPELLDLLAVSRRNNQAVGVTGMLLFKDGNFLQVLEGEREAVRLLFDKIGRDDRHTGLLVLRHVEQEQRDFAQWSMAFYDLHSPEAHAVPGYSPFLNTPLNSPEFQANPSLCHKLLLTFKRTIAPDRGG